MLEMHCQNLLSITSSRLFSLLHGSKKYKDHQSSSAPQSCMHLFSHSCLFLCITSHSGKILLISYLDQTLFFFFFFGILLQDRWFASQAKLPWICNGHWIISTVARIERWHFAIPVNKSSSLNPNQVLFVPKLNQNISAV